MESERAREDDVNLSMAPRMARDGVVWRAGGMALEFRTLVLNYRRRRRRPESDVVVVATCIILNLQFLATCMQVPLDKPICCRHVWVPIEWM